MDETTDTITSAPEETEPAIGQEIADFIEEVWSDWDTGQPAP